MSGDKFKHKYSDIIKKTIEGYDNNERCNEIIQKKCEKNKPKIKECCAKPYITFITPNMGPYNALTIIYIYGGEFGKVKCININGGKVTTFEILNPNRIKVHIPMIKEVSKLYITVSTTTCTSNGVFYCYVEKPIIIRLDPFYSEFYPYGCISINGKNLSTTQTVNYGSMILKPIENINVISDDNIIIHIPYKYPTENIQIYVTTCGGNSNMIKYSHTPPPII
jgi:hypothetical protein